MVRGQTADRDVERVRTADTAGTDPDEHVARPGVGSVSVHQAASDAALAYIEQHYGEEKVLGPYLAALEGRGVEYTTNSPASGRALAASERDGLGR